MAKQKEIKTNAMRILDKLKIEYNHQSYECDEFVDGLDTAEKLNLPYEQVYKTLVTVGSSKEYFVFVIPIDKELDMKKAAKAVGEKSIAMINIKDLNSVTGYVRGGCTSIGMKKQYKTIISDTAEALGKIYVSAGKVGVQLQLTPNDLCRAANAVYGDIIVEHQ
ncbi:Cys-tRNA(Pro) deacylase [Clostridium cellulovorans]|uniref:Cys-tRNA(Pro)/Cys-tRNA(Cys) deacylase n=1 Tax=Clostridium cellulovorans (strain ATCC 35296 / DSM 3052 / OCM 3 / 743B) TaxID=573061 RepID=D9SQD4_CLOC7|nr:Cys-tRNA(Pro) deacylase [Clostridium cellulovorans]ADL50201.1 ybaK/ebsC protein [Clostridium cellulovorans 743B]